MRPISSIRRSLGSALAAVLLFALANTVLAAPDWRSRVSTDLLVVFDNANSRAVPSIKQAVSPGSVIERSVARFDADGRVQVDVNYECANPPPSAELNALGFTTGVSLKVPPLCVVEGWASTASIPDIAMVSSVKVLSIPNYAASKHPIATNQRQAFSQPKIQSASGQTIDGSAVALMRADQFITQTGKNGSGVTIGVISDDASNYQLIQGRAELPTLQILPPSMSPATHPTLTDEGTMMLEEVYAVAPGAALMFCGPETNVEYVECVQQLATAGATVITDDTGYPTVDLMAANNADSLAVQSLLSQFPSLSLFTAADNFNGSYWQGNYTPTSFSSISLSPQTCSTNGQIDNYFNNFGGSAFQLLDVLAAGSFPVMFQWADPNEQNVSNFDVYLVNMATSAVSCFPVSSLTASYTAATLTFAAGQYRIFVATPDQSLSGKFMKLLIAGDGATTLSVPTPGSVASFQAFLPSVMTVGAVLGSDGLGNTIEPYSALGPTALVYPTNVQLQAPVFVAPDGIYVDAVGTNFASNLSGDGLFHGTSAASPNAAAVAALLRSAFPNLTPAQVNGYLQSGATPLGGAAPNSTFGYGRVDALGALAQIPAPMITGLQGTTIVGGSSSQPLPFTIGGTGTLKVRVTAAIFNAVVAPSNCGSSPGTCTLTLTPALGALGTANIQVTVTDGANRSSSMQVPITLTAPPPPTASITSNATQSVIVSSAIAPIGFSLAGTGLTAVSVAESGISGLNVTSGCGTTTSTCTANLGTAGTTTGTALVTLTVRDSYAQVTSTSATVIILPPAAPTISITGGGTQSVTVNGAIAPVTFTLTGMAPLTVTPNTSDISGITITTGCGTTTMSCTASLGTAQGTPGTATLTLKVEDSYVQSASATATVTESAPPGKSGGGALDPWVLLGLTGLVLVQLNNTRRKRNSL